MTSLLHNSLGYKFHYANGLISLFYLAKMFVQEENSRASLGLELEEDILNSNECMAPLCAVVKHLSEAFPVISQAQVRSLTNCKNVKPI